MLKSTLINLAVNCIVLQAIPLASGDFWFSVATSNITTVFYILTHKEENKYVFLVKVALNLENLGAIDLNFKITF
jgi:hypothetical protein